MLYRLVPHELYGASLELERRPAEVRTLETIEQGYVCVHQARTPVEGQARSPLELVQRLRDPCQVP